MCSCDTKKSQGVKYNVLSFMCLQGRFPEGGEADGAAQGPEYSASDRGMYARRATVRHRGIHEVRGPKPVPEGTHTRRGKHHGSQKGIKTTKVRQELRHTSAVRDSVNRFWCRVKLVKHFFLTSYDYDTTLGKKTLVCIPDEFYAWLYPTHQNHTMCKTDYHKWPFPKNWERKISVSTDMGNQFT